MRKLFFITFFFFISLLSITAQEKNTGIIPVPAHVEWRDGLLTVPSKVTFSTNFSGSDLEDITDWMNRTAKGISPFDFQQVKPSKKPMLTLNMTPKGIAESYELSITPKAIIVNATDKAGVFYALQSLSQLAMHYSMKIPQMTIKDQPRFEHRGLLIDVARNFRNIDFIKKQLDMMAYYKLNIFHWHLTDDPAWRIEIKKYPELTEQAAYYPYPNLFEWWRGGQSYCKKDDPKATGGFYTQEEIKDVVEYARKLNITVIPEIDLPSHSSAALSVFPEMTCKGVGGIYCVGNEQTYTFLENVLTEVMELFPSKYIHIGGDEVYKGIWTECSKCQKRMADEGLKDGNELQSYMIKRIDKFLTNKGRNSIGWDEILHGGLAPGATVMSWTGEHGGIEASKQGKKAIMTPEYYCYIDGFQDNPSREPESSGLYLPLERVYSYNPAPESLGSDVTKNILGVQANLWGERIATDQHAEKMLWPRTFAIAEVAWSPNAKKSYEQFKVNALEMLDRMEKLGYSTFDLKNEVGERPEYFEKVNALSTNKKVIYPESDKEAMEFSKLTDGIQGGWNINNDRWVRLHSKQSDVAIDLGGVQPVKSITICFSQTVWRSIFLPEEIEIYASDDNKSYTLVKKIHNDVSSTFKQNEYIKYTWKGQLNARYIRVKAIAASEKYFITDELIVR